MEIIVVKWFGRLSKLEVIEKDFKNRTVRARHIGHYAENLYHFSECLNYTQILYETLCHQWEDMSEEQIEYVNQKALKNYLKNTH